MFPYNVDVDSNLLCTNTSVVGLKIISVFGISNHHYQGMTFLD